MWNYDSSYNELYHHGILGQKWGVRRYQNYDGSYTKAGMKRYNNSKEAYESAKQITGFAKSAYKQTKKNGYAETSNGDRIAVSKNVVKEAKANEKAAKAQMNKDYKHLKQDKLGDQGKELYKNGKTITGNSGVTETLATAGTIIGAGAQYAARSGLLDQKMANYISIGGGALVGVAAVKKGADYLQARKLRAYYGHTSNY